MQLKHDKHIINFKHHRIVVLVKTNVKL